MLFAHVVTLDAGVAPMMTPRSVLLRFGPPIVHWNIATSLRNLAPPKVEDTAVVVSALKVGELVTVSPAISACAPVTAPIRPKTDVTGLPTTDRSTEIRLRITALLMQVDTVYVPDATGMICCAPSLNT